MPTRPLSERPTIKYVFTKEQMEAPDSPLDAWDPIYQNIILPELPDPVHRKLTILLIRTTGTLNVPDPEEWRQKREQSMLRATQAQSPTLVNHNTARLVSSFMLASEQILPVLLAEDDFGLHEHSVGQSDNNFPQSNQHRCFTDILTVLLLFSITVNLTIITPNLESITDKVAGITELAKVTNLYTTLHIAKNAKR